MHFSPSLKEILCKVVSSSGAQGINCAYAIPTGATHLAAAPNCELGQQVKVAGDNCPSSQVSFSTDGVWPTAQIAWQCSLFCITDPSQHGLASVCTLPSITSLASALQGLASWHWRLSTLSSPRSQDKDFSEGANPSLQRGLHEDPDGKLSSIPSQRVAAALRTFLGNEHDNALHLKLYGSNVVSEQCKLCTEGSKPDWQCAVQVVPCGMSVPSRHETSAAFLIPFGAKHSESEHRKAGGSNAPFEQLMLLTVGFQPWRQCGVQNSPELIT